MGNLYTLRRARTGRVAAAPAQVRPEQALELHRQTTEALGQILRPKLTLGSPDDAQEREADALAERVMRLPSAATDADLLQRKCATCRKEDEERVRRAPRPEEEEENDEKLRRAEKPQDEDENKDEDIHAKTNGATAGAGPLAADTASRIEARRGAGMPLPAGERAFFEPRLGADLGGVRLHADPEAADLSRRLTARAFTVGADVFFGTGEYRPGTVKGRRLLAHELSHVQQPEDATAPSVRRWRVGAAPVPAGWSEVTDADQLRRLEQAEDIVRGLVGQRRCQNYFRDNCTNTAGATALQDAFDNANVYLRPVDDNIFGEMEPGGNNIAFNLRAYRVGRYMLASTLLHEMFHTCDPTGAGNAAELSAENAVETCRLHTPWIDSVSPRRGPVGSRVTIRGWNFGPTQGATDRVRIGGVLAPVLSWAFMTDTSSRVEIQVEVPAGARAGGVVVINNNVASNTATFRVT